MKRKILLLTAALVLLTPATTAAIEELDIVNTYPDPVVKDSDVHFTVIAQADSTTTTTIELWFTKPDGTLNLDGTNTVRVKSGDPRQFTLTINEKELNQFGEWRIRVNETDQGLNQTRNFTIIPAPEVTVTTTGQELLRTTGDSTDYVAIEIDPRRGNPIQVPEVQPGPVKLYQVLNRTSTAGEDIHKTEQFSTQIVPNNETGDLEAVLDLENLPEDEYNLVAEFNISSCGSCENFTEVQSTSIRIREEESINDMAAQLSVLLALLFAGGLFAYTGFQMRPRNKKVAALRTMLIMAAPLFAVFATGLAAVFAGNQGFGAANQIMWVVFLAAFILWFVMALVIGLLMYFTDALETGVTQGRREFDQEL